MKLERRWKMVSNKKVDEIIRVIIDCGLEIECMLYNNRFAGYGKQYAYNPQRAHYLRKKAKMYGEVLLERYGIKHTELAKTDPDFEYALQFL